MAREKRKLSEEKPDKSSSSSSKKQRTAGKQHVKVHHLSGSEVAKPVIGTTGIKGGTLLSTSLRFSSYTTTRRKSDKTDDQPLLLLHSTSHETIDFNAVESRTIDANERHLKHYVAVFDPANKRLEVTEAKKVTVKGQVRKLAQKKASDDDDDDEDDDDGEKAGETPAYSSRVALTEAFGSKKSKKAVATIAENRLIANSAGSDDPLAKAILSTVGDEYDGEDDNENENGENSGQTTKPLPPANLEATDVNDVYPLSTLVVPQPTAATLDSMPLTEWKRQLSNKKAVSSHYRYIAHRVIIIGQRHMQNQSDKSMLQTLQVLRYIEFLLDLHRYANSLSSSRRGGGAVIPFTDQWPSTAIKDGTQIPEYVVKQAAIHFFPDSRLTHFALTRLRTWILALTLHIPPGLAVTAGPGILAVEPSDILLDLSLPPNKNTYLYRELGCKVERAKETEATRWRLKVLEKQQTGTGTGDKAPSSPSAGAGAAGNKKPVFAKLVLPLEFPKLSMGRAPSSRGRR